MKVATETPDPATAGFKEDGLERSVKVLVKLGSIWEDEIASTTIIVRIPEFILVLYIEEMVLESFSAGAATKGKLGSVT